MTPSPGGVWCQPVPGVGEVRPGDDLAALLADAVAAGDRLGSRFGPQDGDVWVVTSKAVSKAEGRVTRMPKEQALAQETTQLVARRGGTSIVRTRQGPVMAAAGIDASNTEPGTLVLLPEDPDASARRLREDLTARLGSNLAVVVTDTAGRAWRNGQCDIAIGAAGLQVLDDHQGREDGYGNVLAVTAPAVADEVAALAELATGKLSRCPAAVVRGLDRFVLAAGDHGPGAAALVRPVEQDMFGLGAREAVLSALRRESAAAFGRPAVADEVASVLAGVLRSDDADLDARAVDESRVDLVGPVSPGVGPATVVRLETAAFALGWLPDDATLPDAGSTTALRFRPRTP